MTSGGAGEPVGTPDSAALEALRTENDALRRELSLLSQAVGESLQEISALSRRQREIQAQTRIVEASLAAIRASNSWRMLDVGRRAWFRTRGLRMALRGSVGSMRGGRRSGTPPAAVRASPLGVNVSGYLAAESGLGEAARSSIRVLERAAIPVVLNNISGAQRATDQTYTAFSRENPHPFNLVHLNADNMAAFGREQGKRYFRDRYTIGFWFWELSRFRKDWNHAFRVVDEVWVATRFTRDAISASAPVPVVRMPLPVTIPVTANVGRAHFGIPDDRFAFLFTFDVSSQTERKNPLAVVRAFRRSGLSRDRAVLVLKFTNEQFDRDMVRRISEAGEGADVLLLGGFMDRPDLGALVSVCDCYVSLHRAEGFGLTMAEAMVLGKPVIATGYSGNMDFMTADSACLVDYRLTPLVRDYGPYLRGSEWAEPDIDQAAHAMRRMVDSPDWARELGRRGAAEVEARLGLDAVADRYRRRLETIRTGTTAVTDQDA
jgi:glycosyltransferase involved in cell wall biosynthesis